jgi:7-cyano-7-deazaguanine synthase
VPDHPRHIAVVLLSGGLDSATVLAVARDRRLACLTVAFDYGQRHRHELAAAERVAAALGAFEHRTVALDPRAFAGSALTPAAGAPDAGVPKGRNLASMPQSIPATYVPARNLVFLAMATAAAESISAGSVWIGVNAVDFSGYPDCRPAFIDAFQQAARLGTRAGTVGDGIAIQAPLLAMTKAEIIRLGTSLGVDYALTMSCYDPAGPAERPLACGACDACVLRREGFAAAGVEDPTRYAPRIQ